MDQAVHEEGVHPGVVLGDRLKALGLSATALSKNLTVPANRVTSILNGNRGITGDTALRLGHFFDCDPEYWLRLQAEYDLYVTRKQIRNEILSLPTIKTKGLTQREYIA